MGFKPADVFVFLMVVLGWMMGGYGRCLGDSYRFRIQRWEEVEIEVLWNGARTGSILAAGLLEFFSFNEEEECYAHDSLHALSVLSLLQCLGLDVQHQPPFFPHCT